MPELKFKFSIQAYQTEAVESVAEVFAGQPFNARSPGRGEAAVRRDITNWNIPEEELETGFANAQVALNSSALLANVRRIQQRNNIRLSDSLASGGLGCCSLDVEMETGTGKTYVYIKTMFELNQRYGWSKFIVVVPSIAVREGVRKSFDAMQEHFMEYYGRKARFFVYDSANLEDIDNFAQSADINVMIINIQAFNARGRDARRIRTNLDEFGGRKPIEVIRAARSIVILDEPQKMGGAATRESLKEFNPLFCLNYSATHKQHHTLVYALDALDAYRRKLVKRIEVKGFDVKNLRGTDSYLFLEQIVVSPAKPPMARIELEIGYGNSINRETRLIGVDSDLFALSRNMEQYREYRVSEIDPLRGTVAFTNGESLRVGEVAGDVSESALRRVQIRETIRSHLEKERELFGAGVKVLSLFFIDEVAKYRKYDDAGKEINSEYGEIFEQEYRNLREEFLLMSNSPAYERYLRGIEPCGTHAGYFSIDKKGRKVDSRAKRGGDESDDVSAYELILKNKERLLSLDNPVRFIFSHSALREGWDNPNVFQICTLKHGGSSPVQKRQEVGRGLRLCVNQNGDRQDAESLGDRVHQINQLTVIASDGYKDFVADLQRGILEDLSERPARATEAYFTGKTILCNGREVTISARQGHDIYFYLVRNGYIDAEGLVTDQYRADRENGVLAPVLESCAEIAEGVHALIQSIFDEHALDGMIRDGRETRIQENALNGNFYKKEFQTLWNCINRKYTYTVEFDSEELIGKAVAHLNEKMFVAKLQYAVTVGGLRDNWDPEQLKSGTGFETKPGGVATRTLECLESSHVKYDLVGKIAEGAKLTRRSAAAILRGLRPEIFAMFKNNPEEFISKAVRLISEQKTTMIVEQISYNRTDGTYDSAIFTAEKNSDFSRAYKAEKNVQDYVLTDGAAERSVERRFAEDMDHAAEVCVYAKLPRGFAIHTPVGNYSPDWAIAFNQGTVKHIFFVAETKGSMESLNLRPIEQAKIRCAKKLFQELSTADVVYHEVDSYQNLLNIMERL